MDLLVLRRGFSVSRPPQRARPQPSGRQREGLLFRKGPGCARLGVGGAVGRRLEKAEDFLLPRLLPLAGVGIILMEGQGGSFSERREIRTFRLFGWGIGSSPENIQLAKHPDRECRLVLRRRFSQRVFVEQNLFFSNRTAKR